MELSRRTRSAYPSARPDLHRGSAISAQPMNNGLQLAARVAIVWMALIMPASAVAASKPDDESSIIDLSGYELTFNEDFDRLDVSAWGPGTRWIAHTPWRGDFGDAAFADPTPDFPFTIKDGILRIEARKGADGKWRSGLLASTDPQGNGFVQQFGYFEMRAKLPPGSGVWPAFWLIANRDEKTSAEIDVLEYYGVGPDVYHSTVHVWPKIAGVEKQTHHIRHKVPYGSLYEDFHTYGVSVESDSIIFYLDRKEMGRVKTPPEHHRPMFILLNLALGSGWPIDKTINPSYMYVDYVRAYRRR
jgi:beta-glucanase (GH16 family)